MRQRRAGDLADAEADRTGEQPDELGAEEKRRAARQRQARRRSHYFAAATAIARCATVRMKSTIRGPQRDAMSSLTPTTPPFVSALIELQPARAFTFAAVWPQHFVSARTIRSGFAATMYSAESFG